MYDVMVSAETAIPAKRGIQIQHLGWFDKDKMKRVKYLDGPALRIVRFRKILLRPSGTLKVTFPLTISSAKLSVCLYP